MKYCANCEQHVEPDGRVNWMIFLLCFVLLLPWLPYLLYCLIFKDKSCPQCGAANWGANTEEDAAEEEDDE